jgi:hypothetical protein
MLKDQNSKSHINFAVVSLNHQLVENLPASTKYTKIVTTHKLCKALVRIVIPGQEYPI